MKRLKLLAIGSLIAVSLVACGQKQETKEQMDNKMATEQTKMENDKDKAQEMKTDEKKEEKNDEMKDENKTDEKMNDDKKMEEKTDEKMKSDDKMANDKKADDNMSSDKKESDKAVAEKKTETKSQEKPVNDKKTTEKKVEEKKAENKKANETKPAQEKSKTETAKSGKMNDGELAPDFTLSDKNGNVFTLSSQIGKKKTYIKFWASWCSVCLAGLEEFNKLAGENNDFEIVSVVAPGIGAEMKKEEFIKWFDSLGYSNIRVLFDETGEVMGSYGIRAFPTSAVVGSDGVLIGVQPGEIGSDVIKRVFQEVK